MLCLQKPTCSHTTHADFRVAICRPQPSNDEKPHNRLTKGNYRRSSIHRRCPVQAPETIKLGKPRKLPSHHQFVPLHPVMLPLPPPVYTPPPLPSVRTCWISSGPARRRHARCPTCAARSRRPARPGAGPARNWTTRPRRHPPHPATSRLPRGGGGEGRSVGVGGRAETQSFVFFAYLGFKAY